MVFRVSTDIIMSSINSDNLTSFFQFGFLGLLFFPNCCSQVFKLLLNKCGHPRLVPDVRESSFDSSPLRIIDIE